MIDTHSHIYDSAFDDDRDQAVARAVAAGVGTILMPAIDSGSHDALIATAARYPGRCLPMMGLHPTSVNDNPDYAKELEAVASYLDNPPVERFYAVGETGLDLYWSGEFLEQQAEALLFQAELALRHDLPLVLHCRNAWAELPRLLSPLRGRGLRGVLHAFSGSLDNLRQIGGIGYFMVGIGGPVTYRTGPLPGLIPHIPRELMLLETDSPYLPPTPWRGRRNESGYLPLICARVAEILGVAPESVAEQTTANARLMFGL